MSEKILLGFEVNTAEPIYLPLHHLAIFGMTQLSGKTTCLEALITRSGLRAIAFITKRGESGFTKYNLVTPYYKQRCDWQYVESLVNVALGEKVKYEPGMRWAIMKVSRGSHNLQEVRERARKQLEQAKREFQKAVFEKLIAYLDIVVPELERWTFSTKLELKEGVNVMDLSEMRLETQQLVISSTIEYAFQKLTGVIVIVPEAWEQLPQFRMTPVKWVAEQFVRKGAAIDNYLWLDSQDIGGIDKTPLRQCDNWLMGRMKEAHEVERILKQLLGLKVPKEEIQTLKLGHFYAAIGNRVVKVYALPAGVPEDVGRKVALNELTPEYVRDKFLKVKVMEDEEMWKERYERLKARFDGLQRGAKEEIETLRDRLAELENLREWKDKLIQQVGALESENASLKEALESSEKIREVFSELIQGELKRLEREPYKKGTAGLEPAAPSEVAVDIEQPALTVNVLRKAISLDQSDLAGKIAIIYAEGQLPKDKWFTVTHVTNAFRSHGWKKDPRTSTILDQFCEWGYFEKHYAGKRPEYRMRMTPEEAREKGFLKTIEKVEV